MRKILTEKVGWYMAVCLLLALLVGSCHQDRELELELIPELTLQEKVAALVPAARNAVMGRSLSNVFSAPKLESLKTYGKRAFTAPLPHAKLERLGWEALLIAAVDPAGRLHTAVIVRPAKRGDSYSQYGFSPEGYQQYRIEVSKGRPVKWFVPRQSSHYETVFGGNTKLKKSGSDDDGEWNCGEIDECVVYPYDHIDDDDDEDENNGGYYDPDDTNWWDDTPPRDWNDGAGGGSSGGDTGNNDRPEPTDPCENIKNMKDNAALNGKLKELMDYAKKEPIEYSYSRDNEDGHEAIIGHKSGETYFYIEKNKDLVINNRFSIFPQILRYEMCKMW